MSQTPRLGFPLSNSPNTLPDFRSLLLRDLDALSRDALFKVMDSLVGTFHPRDTLQTILGGDPRVLWWERWT
jgi:hypothetical protein